MLGILFALACWGVWYLTPHHIATLAFEKDAIIHGEWWRLWTAHFTHVHYAQMVTDVGVLAVAGLIAGRFVKAWQLGLVMLIAMPVMTGLLFILMPHLLFFRGAIGIAAMLWMIATWFLIVESERFSLGYWLGIIFLLLFIGKVGMESLMLLEHTNHHAASLKVAWLVQFFGTLLGLTFFNALHQIHLTRSGDNPQYRGPYAEQPKRPMPAKLNAGVNTSSHTQGNPPRRRAQ